MSNETEHRILFIHALTGLHPGSGTALGVVDLPVQRERHTQWPIIPGSSLKGILRDVLRSKHDNETWLALFGPETENAHEHAGALALTDARILAFPVRSLRGVFAWVTCPAVLQRLKRDLALAGMSVPALNPVPQKDAALCAEGSPLLLSDGKLILEEFEFAREGTAGDVPAWIAKNVSDDSETQERIKSHLAVLHDDDFTHFVRHATEVVARVGLNYETKTVKEGALFYEEFLPPETLFYSLLIAESSRRRNKEMSAGGVQRCVRDSLPAVLQIGGDETIGKGLCSVKLRGEKEA